MKYFTFYFLFTPQKKMELVDDIIKIIVFKLKKNIITLLNKKYRDLYFREKGIKIIGFKILNNGPQLLYKYNIDLKVVAPQSYLGVTKFVPQKVLDNINKITRLHMEALKNKNFAHFILNVRNLKRVKILWGNFIFDKYSINTKFLLDKKIKISLSTDRLSQNIIDFIDVFPPNNKPLIYLWGFKQYIKREYLERISPYIYKMDCFQNISEMTGLNFPKLEIVVSHPITLAEYSGKLPLLREIQWSHVGPDITDGRLEKYSYIKQKFNKVITVKFWPEMNMDLYKKIRKRYFNPNHKWLDHPFYSVGELEIIEKLEAKYRTENNDRVAFTIVEKSLIDYIRIFQDSKITQYFAIHYK